MYPIHSSDLVALVLLVVPEVVVAAVVVAAAEAAAAVVVVVAWAKHFHHRVFETSLHRSLPTAAAVVVAGLAHLQQER